MTIPQFGAVSLIYSVKQVTYTFPVGLTTLWWYGEYLLPLRSYSVIPIYDYLAPVINRLEGDEAETLPVFAEHEGAQSAFQFVDQSEAY